MALAKRSPLSMYDKMMKLERTKERWIQTEKDKLDTKLLKQCTFRPEISELKRIPKYRNRRDKSLVKNLPLEKNNQVKSEMMNQLAEPDDS